MSSYVDILTQELPPISPPRIGLSLASFFCGGGGFDLGFRSAGIELLYANEINPIPAKVYEANLGHTPVLGDIREQKTFPKGIDIVTGGFPCVTFSTQGSRLGIIDDIAGKLYLELCRVIKQIQPRYFIAENVKGLLSANHGDAIKVIMSTFANLGYQVQYRLINMAEHGVASRRERVIIVGIRNDLVSNNIRFLYPLQTHNANDKNKKAWFANAYTMEDIYDPNSIQQQKGVKPTTSSLHSPDRSRTTYVSSERVFNIKVIPATITSGGSAPFIRKPDGTTRRMNIRESARAQSFPDWYKFCELDGIGHDNAKYVIGNAVPPLYAKKIAQAIVDYDRRLNKC
jgi:DNA (cytosine-5)-methyltransferase 1